MCSVSVYAQDVIVKKDGSTILSKVLEVNTADIKYKKYSNQNGPIYTINKSDVMTINYENGEKDSFLSNSESVGDNSSMSSGGYVNKKADSRNSDIIDFYRRIYKPTSKVKTKDKPASTYALIFGVTPSSIMSNEDIEMNFVRDIVKGPYYNRKHLVYYINLKNKTDKVIYVDKGNCFKILQDGKYTCYFDNSMQTTVNMGGGSGGNLGLGSVASVLGIGGVAGQLASGINVGGGTSHSVSKTYSPQRVIAIPPHGNINLSEEKYIQTKEGSLLSSSSYEQVERAESFMFHGWEGDDKPSDEYNIASSKLGMTKGMVKYGQTALFKENDLPWKREYVITYSTKDTFDTYSSLKVQLFIYEIIGTSFIGFDNEPNEYDGSFEDYIEGLSPNTIVSYHNPNKK